MTAALHDQLEILIDAIDDFEERHGGLLSKDILRIASETRIALAAAKREHAAAKARQDAIAGNRNPNEA